ncbi:MAG: histidine kinase, partial [Cellvibrionaceae bacterium]|nr:histidine kinase [Cellvibrionaceae bacterium]
ENSECLVLPVLARDEEQQPTTQESMFNYVRLSDGGISRIPGARSEVSILAALASRLVDKQCFDFEVFTNHQQIREAIAASIPGMSQLKDIAVAKKEFHVQGRVKHRPEFNTASGKAAFVVHPLPGERHADGDFPLVLATVRSEGQFNSIIYELHDSYRQKATRDSILMSVEDMKAFNLSEGQRVTVSSAFGEMKNAQVKRFDLPRGNCLAYYPEANVLTGNELDPRSLTPNFKSVAVKIIA